MKVGWSSSPGSVQVTVGAVAGAGPNRTFDTVAAVEAGGQHVPDVEPAHRGAVGAARGAVVVHVDPEGRDRPALDERRRRRSSSARSARWPARRRPRRP